MTDTSLNLKFSSPKLREVFLCHKRNICINGGYGSGKTYGALQKALALMIRFPGYRVAVGRYTSKALHETTKKTFFKICPPFLYDDSNGSLGRNVRDSVRLINGSEIIWMHFDDLSEDALKSLEINMAIVDQAEEISERVYLTLDSRVGRWEEINWAKVPSDIIAGLPKNRFTKKPEAPSYMLIICNPPDEGEFSYIYQRFHPESQFSEQYQESHAYFEVTSFENKALTQEDIQTNLSRDAEWIDRFVFGKFSKGEGAIHSITPLSVLEVSHEWLQSLLTRATLTRSLDHGLTSPTCCLWTAALNGFYYVYREYYRPDTVITEHRKNITFLSGSEQYHLSVADPAIFHKESSKYGGFWSVADEYQDTSIGSCPLFWSPADNNEYATRNRINELLKVNPNIEHPITGDKGSPRLFFLKRSTEMPNGCDRVIAETSCQKKKLLDEVNGKKFYSDARDEKVVDHAYDTLRYYISTHLMGMVQTIPDINHNSFDAVRNRVIAGKKYRDRYGMPTIQ